MYLRILNSTLLCFSECPQFNYFRRYFTNAIQIRDCMKIGIPETEVTLCLGAVFLEAGLWFSDL